MFIFLDIYNFTMRWESKKDSDNLIFYNVRV